MKAGGVGGTSQQEIVSIWNAHKAHDMIWNNQIGRENSINQIEDNKHWTDLWSAAIEIGWSV